MAPSTNSESSDYLLPRLEPRVLRQEVLAVLRRAILTKDLNVGARILEADVAKQMGVSRAPVREAIRQLEQEGLVTFAPHRGAVVVGLPEEEIDAIYEMRAVIESRAMARLAATMTPEQDAQIADLIGRMKSPLAAGDFETVAELDWQLHGLIIELSNFKLLSRTWASLAGLVRLRSYQALDKDTAASDYFIRTSLQSHERLLEALRSGDPDKASRAGSAHVLEVPARLTSVNDVNPPATARHRAVNGPARRH